MTSDIEFYLDALSHAEVLARDELAVLKFYGRRPQHADLARKMQAAHTRALGAAGLPARLRAHSENVALRGELLAAAKRRTRRSRTDG